jgi:hypothetical protein
MSNPAKILGGNPASAWCEKNPDIEKEIQSVFGKII